MKISNVFIVTWILRRSTIPENWITRIYKGENRNNTKNQQKTPYYLCPKSLMRTESNHIFKCSGGVCPLKEVYEEFFG